MISKQDTIAFPEGMHLVFYTLTKNGVDIIGIPHQSMDVTNHIGTDQFPNQARSVETCFYYYRLMPVIQAPTIVEKWT